MYSFDEEPFALLDTRDISAIEVIMFVRYISTDISSEDSTNAAMY